MIATSSRTSSGCTSGTGLAIAKTIASGAIVRTPAGGHRAGAGHAEQHVGARQHLVGACRGRWRAVGALGERGARRVAARRRPRTARRRRSQTITSPTPWASMMSVHATPAAPAPTTTTVHVLGALADDPQRVEQRGEHDDRGAVLVVVEDRDVELRAQPPLDLEAARRRDVLEVDAAERRRGRLDERDDLVDVLGVEAQRERVDAGELLEQHRLALHHRHRGRRADVAEPEHGGAVGDDRDRVALDRQRPAPSPGPRGSPCRRAPTPGV